MVKCFHIFLRASKSGKYVVAVVFLFFLILFTLILFFIIKPDLCQQIFGSNLYGIIDSEVVWAFKSTKRGLADIQALSKEQEICQANLHVAPRKDIFVIHRQAVLEKKV